VADEAYLREVTIGEPKRLDGPVVLSPYDASWPVRYELLAQRVRNALGSSVIFLEHVGSTSVPGLSAKPVIDMVLAVSDSTDEEAYVPPLASQGFQLRIREPGWFEHRLLHHTDIAANLHVFSAGCDEIDRMIAFRDRLRSHDEDRRRYERAKRELSVRHWKYLQDYADAKSEIVRGILRKVS